MQRTKRFAFVLTETEKDLVERLAEIEGGLSQAALMRRLIRKAAREILVSSYFVSNTTLEEKHHEKRQ